MELKTKYQYTYFIYPYIIKQKNLNRYFLSLLKNPSFEMKTFDKEKDEDLYSYFLPKVRNTMFWTMGLNRSKLTKFYDLDVATQATLLTEYPCTMFEYSLNEDIQGKAGKRDGIFFDITNITLVCFNTGICFMLMKTMLEGENSLANICNFNYKFRDIKSEAYDYRGYENIKIQTDRFNTIKEITDLITEITGENKEAAKMNIDTNRFITYSYACIEQDYWNEYRKFENIEHNFIKFTNIMPASNIASFIKDESVTISEWKYAKLGLTKQGITLFSSATEMNNYTILPEEFETQYFYTYILNLYKKIYLKKLGFEFSNSKNVKKARKKFIEFTKKIWIQEITEDESGTIINHRLNEVLELDSLYLSTKNKYDVLYKDLNIEKNSKSTIIIAFILLASLIFNIMNFIQILNK